VSWPRVTLGQVAEINPCLPKSADEKQQVSFLGMASVSMQGEITSEETRVLAETKKGFTYFERGDVLLAKITPCFENGKAVYTNSLKNPIGYGSTEFHVLRSKNGILDAKYMFYMVWSDQFRFLGGKAMKGAAGQKRISADFLKEFNIPLPPLPEQKRIAAILDKADSLRRKNQQAIQLADQFLRAVFLDMFGDPATNPKGWEIKTVADISTRVTKGESPKWQGFNYEDQGVRFITSENVLWGELDYRYKYISEKFNEKLFRSQLCERDLLINLVGASVGRVCLATKESLPANINQAVSVITLNPEILLPEIALRQILTPSIQKKLLGNVVDAARANISLTNIRELELAIPPMNKQREFLTFIKKINLAMEKQKRTKYLPFFDALSQKAFAGEL
jgi:type I restriction enzyme S subunit